MKEKNMNNQELIYLCRQLSMLLKAGISLLEGISILKEDADTEDGKRSSPSFMMNCWKAETSSLRWKKQRFFPRISSIW